MKRLKGQNAIVKLDGEEVGRVSQDLVDALCYAAAAEEKALIRSTRNIIVKIFNCYEKAGYQKIHIHGTAGFKEEGWVEPEANFPPFNVLGKFSVSEIDPGEIF